MDAIIFIMIALVLVIRADRVPESEAAKTVEYVAEDTQRTTMLNETFYEDKEAFYEIAHALGFPKEQ